MVYQLELRHDYPVSPGRIREVLTNLEYLRDKLRAVSGPGAKLVWYERDDHGVTIVLDYAVPGEALPSYLRSVWPDGVTIRRNETWTASGANVHAVIDGIPGSVSVALHLKSAPIGCEFGALLTAEVPLPTFGDTIEKMITKKVAEQMATEYQFTLDWLRDSAARRLLHGPDC